MACFDSIDDALIRLIWDLSAMSDQEKLQKAIDAFKLAVLREVVPIVKAVTELALKLKKV
ncbi:hypothetical protein GCM10027592_29410 [Spirosoma flavus]